MNEEKIEFVDVNDPEKGIVSFLQERRAQEFLDAGQKPPLPGATVPAFSAGRFVLECEAEGVWGYVTSWDTWEEASAAFEAPPMNLAERDSISREDWLRVHGRIPSKFRLTDDETGRVWHHSARYEWEHAQT